MFENRVGKLLGPHCAWRQGSGAEGGLAANLSTKSSINGSQRKRWWPSDFDGWYGSDLVGEGSEVGNVNCEPGNDLRAQNLKHEFFDHDGKRVAPEDVTRYYESAGVHEFDV
jgi:hypothetical protein